MADELPPGVCWCMAHPGEVMVVDRLRGWSPGFGRYRIYLDYVDVRETPAETERRKSMPTGWDQAAAGGPAAARVPPPYRHVQQVCQGLAARCLTQAADMLDRHRRLFEVQAINLHLLLQTGAKYLRTMHDIVRTQDTLLALVDPEAVDAVAAMACEGVTRLAGGQSRVPALRLTVPVEVADAEPDGDGEAEAGYPPEAEGEDADASEGDMEPDPDLAELLRASEFHVPEALKRPYSPDPDEAEERAVAPRVS